MKKSWQSIMGGTGNNSNTKETLQSKWIPKACFTVKQTRTKERASLTDVDVIVFVNNTQLDAVDQLRLLKASPCTQRTKTSTAIHPHHPLPAVSSFSLCAEELRRGCCCHKVTPSIHPRHTHLHPAITDTFPSAGPFRSLPCRWKITRALIHDQHVAVAASITVLPPVRRRMGEINNYYELVLRPIAELKMRHRQKTTFGSSAKSFASKHKSLSIVFSIAESYSGPFCLVISPPHTHAHTQSGEAQSHLKR